MIKHVKVLKYYEIGSFLGCICFHLSVLEKYSFINIKLVILFE